MQELILDELDAGSFEPYLALLGEIEAGSHYTPPTRSTWHG